MPLLEDNVRLCSAGSKTQVASEHLLHLSSISSFVHLSLRDGGRDMVRQDGFHD